MVVYLASNASSKSGKVRGRSLPACAAPHRGAVEPAFGGESGRLPVIGDAAIDRPMCGGFSFLPITVSFLPWGVGGVLA